LKSSDTHIEGLVTEVTKKGTPATTLISIVIPVYNAKRWLSETLRSVCAQNVQRSQVDLIVVDDGSTDGSDEIARRELEHSGLSFQIVRQENGGASRARNLGWRKSSASWIQFLDADDLLAADKILAQARACEELPLSVAVVYSDWQCLLPGAGAFDEPEPIRRPCITGDVVANLLLDSNFIHTGSCLVRRCWLEAVSGFDETLEVIEDVNLLLRLAMAGGTFQYVSSEQPAFFYRKHRAGSLSTRSRTEFAEGCVRNVQMVEDYWRSRSELIPSRIAILADCYLQAARYFAEVDRERFAGLANHLAELMPGFIPREPASLRILSKLVGYPRAERISTIYRALKRAGAKLRIGAPDLYPNV
jgi:glycosyltransferase involved in cell wall biosynthesis